MKAIFTALTRFSLRFWAITLLVVLLVSILGGVAITQLKQELLPPIDIPQTYILAQASGMTSDQVLNVVTKRIEDKLHTIPEIINIESTTSGAFGAFITASNDFGLDQQKLRTKIQLAMDSVWFPQRRIQPASGQNPQEFSTKLLTDLTPDVLIYLADTDPNFLFQLSPDVWAALPDDVVRTLLTYLAWQVEKPEAGKTGLERLVDQEITPQLRALDVVASTAVSGGQLLPGESSVNVAANGSETASRLLKLSPSIWKVVAPKAGLDQLNNDTIAKLKQQPEPAVPAIAPMLPQSWQQDHFVDATDLVEVRTTTRSLAQLFNDFLQTGVIVGALGQTNDLTPDTVKQMIEIDPSLVDYFDTEQLVAMPQNVFDALPADFIKKFEASADDFTRDALAARSLAEQISGAPKPVNLPAAWRIQPPQTITFNFSDLPLATFSVQVENPSSTATNLSANTDPNSAATPAQTGAPAIPTGPNLPPFFAVFGIKTADQLIGYPLLLGTKLRAADVLGLIVLAGSTDNAAVPPQLAFLVNNIKGGLAGTSAEQVIAELSPDVIKFLIANDPTFLPNLTPGVYNAFSDAVLMLPEMVIPLTSDQNSQDTWNRVLASRTAVPTVVELIQAGAGKPSAVLNKISTAAKSDPTTFSTVSIRLLNSLNPAALRYFALHEPDFYKNLDTDVLRKLSPAALKVLPQSFLDTLDKDLAAELQGIASGERPSAFAGIQVGTNTTGSNKDPNAPALNPEWKTVADFLGIELDTADDLLRFPDKIKAPAQFINSLLTGPGASFAPGLIGGMSLEAVNYLAQHDPNFLKDLAPDALRLLNKDVLHALPADVQARATATGDVFKPTRSITRNDGNSSLLLTVYQVKDANNVLAFHQVDDLLRQIDAQDDSIKISVVTQQASFVEESISGVAREGSLGAFFAVVVILLFLSGGIWSRSPRRIAGIVMTVLFVGLLVVAILSGLSQAGGDIGAAFSQIDVIVRVLLILGIVVGLVVLLLPRNIPYPAWRSTLVTGISIPLSILMAFALMRWVPSTVHGILAPYAENSSLLTFVLRLFPESLTLNIMTLSGLTVAIGRVVDDSIVVLENIFRQIQAGHVQTQEEKRQAILTGTRDVSVAIFAATVVTIVVFLPLGMTGGIIGAFFLPFGLAVSYALACSFVVAITVVPVLVYLLVGAGDVTEEGEGAMARLYQSTLRWALGSGRNRLTVLAIAFVSLIIGGILFASRPTTFLPTLGEPEISISVNLPSGTKMLETNDKVSQMEKAIPTIVAPGELSVIRTEVGGGGLSLASLLGAGGSVSENVANVSVGLKSGTDVDLRTQQIRQQAESIFGKDNVRVSAGASGTGSFGGFSLVLSGDQKDLEAINDKIIQTLDSIPGFTNASSNLSQVSAGGDDSTPITYLRVDLQSAVSYSGELETENTLGVTQQAIQLIKALPEIKEKNITVSQGFQSELQTQGFASLFIAMGIAIFMVVIILMITFGSLVHWLDIILSIIVAPVGAAVLLTLTNRVLGISAMIGLLMLIGIVVTNAVVLIDRVNANRHERKMAVYDALIEAGGRRLRPILMTALATIMALIPLAIGLSKGAIIASELGTVVIGGLFSSTLLTLIVVPVAYSLLAPVHHWVMSIFGRRD